MRSLVTTAIVLVVVLIAAAADARGVRTQRDGAAGGAARGAAPRGRAGRASRQGHGGGADPLQCDSPRAAGAYGSSARCLRTLCAGQNVTNAYVLDRAHRLRRNLCAGVDPFDLDR